MIAIKGIDPNMIANNLTSYLPTHPGVLLKEEIEHRGISQRSLASKMGVAYSVMNEILNAKRPVTTEYALLFEAALGIDAGVFIRMQAQYNIQLTRQDKRFSDRLAEVRKLAAIL